MKMKGLLVTGLAVSMLVTGCGNVNNYGAERGTRHGDNPGNAFNVNYDNPNRDNRNVRNDNINPRRVNDTREPRLQVADKVADKVTDLNEVNTCNVMITNHNAYVAAVLEGNNNQELSNDIEKKIANQVRKADPSVRNVYVSVNPEFVDRMEGYTNDIREGRPITGIFDEFTEVVRRIFPTNR
ncbi:YhcN/YlaJ family sporulation lipoprotein [Sutcliffiella rhizosphaerae]|uniref:Spore germination lipoprotein YhcN n=1 Tax=Sutcliffiella rhizosphaerae TaxID=2880967 RepID=A0ABN8A945_9BACI|nr:YhcN/YlaJ family sporulation lipoprotein [Sutcliffiella rhizosphaerae]CAG9621690.1 putative spore germination lipoprotein YhcN [Sutcliffiella rhizosphaerae]